MKVLNVGGGSRELPGQYAGWDQTLLDINEAVKPDICCDAKDVHKRRDLCAEFDAVYSSHCLEHFYQHDVDLVLRGFLHTLNEEGFAEIFVPNLSELFRELQARNHDVGDIWYRTGQGRPITFHDVLYGWGEAMFRGNLYYAHRCGFSALSLGRALEAAGFGSVFVTELGSNLRAIAYKKVGAACPH